MRSAERDGKSADFLCHRGSLVSCHSLRGGVWHDFSLRSTTAAFVHLPHSAVVSQFEKAIMRPKGRMMARTRATPPPKKKWGVMRTRIDGICGMPLSGPMTGRSRPHLSLREGSETPLSPRALLCRIGPRRQGFAAPLRALDGCGPIRKTRCLRGERGGARSGGYGVSAENRGGR